MNSFSASLRSPKGSPKKSIATTLSDVMEAKGNSSPSSPQACKKSGEAVQVKTSPYPKRSLKRALLTWERDTAKGVSEQSAASEGERHRTSNEGERHPPLIEGEQQFTSYWSSKAKILDYMNQIFPGRRNEINELLNLLGQPTDPVPPVFVYGPAATGKTSIVREAMRVLRRPHAYVSCRSSHSPRLMFESILNQLLGHVRSSANNYASAIRCERLIDFTKHLPGACVHAASRKSTQTKKKLSSIKKSTPKAASKTHGEETNKMVYLIFDNVELTRGWNGGTLFLAALFKLSELTRLPNLGLLFISSVGLDGYQASTMAREPLPLYCRDYNDSELYQILLLQRPNVELYASFLSAVLKTFSRACRRVTELSRSLEPLYQKYCEPVLRGAAMTPDDQGKRQRYALLQPHIRPALSQTLTILDSPAVSEWWQLAMHDGDDGPIRCDWQSQGPGKSMADRAGGNKGRKKSTPKRTLSSEIDNQELSFELPLCSKYLLLAAYIASRNAATLDASLFDTGDGARASGRKRRKNASSAMEKKEAEAHEQQLKGPGSFPLERLLAIFRCIVVESDSAPTHGFFGPQSASFSTPNEGEVERDGEVTEELTADVLMQLSTLVSVNLLCKSSTNPLEGSARYRCNVDGGLIQKVARSVQFPLSKYLLHG